MTCGCIGRRGNRVYMDATDGDVGDDASEQSLCSNSIDMSSQTMQSVENAANSKISVSKAKLHRYLTTPNWGPSRKFAPYSLWHFPVTLFNDYGIGVKLYFELLYKLSFVACVICLLFVPIYVFLFTTKHNAFSGASSFGFERLSLGAVGRDTVDGADVRIFGSIHSITYIAWCDFFCILLILCLVQYFESQLRAKEKEYDDMTKTVGDYSVEVTNVPPTLKCREQLADWFADRFGEVADVALCYNDGAIIKLFAQHAHIIDEFVISKVSFSKAVKASARAKQSNKLQRLQTKLDQSTMHMLQTAHQHNDGTRFCVKAYVTFEHEPQRNQCLREYYKLRSSWSCSCRRNQRFVFNDRSSLEINEAPEPSNILYLNHGYSKPNLFCRRSLTFVLSMLIIVVSSAILFSAEVSAKQSTVETADCAQTYTASDVAQLQEQPHQHQQHITDCYCSQIGLRSAIRHDMCTAYLKTHLKVQALTTISSVIVVLVNLILSTLITKLADFEKHETISKHQTALSQKIFVSQFLNTAATILIINLNLNSIGVSNNLFGGEYDIAFESEWSSNVGNSILLTLVLGCLNPDLMPVLKLKYEKRKRAKAALSVQTQIELNAAFNGKEFTLDERYADVCCKICVILVYAPLLPLLWLVLFATTFCAYWLNKVFFLRIAAIPPKYDCKLARTAVYFIKSGISLHLVMTFWVFGCTYRDPYQLDTIVDSFFPTFLRQHINDTLFSTLFSLNALPFIVLFVVLHLMNLGKAVVHCVCCMSEETFEDEQGLLPFSEEYVRSENMELYQVCAQPSLKSAFGDGLLPAQPILSQARIDAAANEYKKQLAKEMVDELMNVDLEKEDDDGDDSAKKRLKEKFLNIAPEHWSIRQVGIWLNLTFEFGDQYLYAFMLNKVNGQRLLNVTDAFLEETIQIAKIVHRNKILKAVRKLRIRCGLDKAIKKKLSKEERKELEMVELQNYTRHLALTEKYTEYAFNFQQHELVSD